MKYSRLAEFADFILKNHLKEFTNLTVQKLQEKRVPVNVYLNTSENEKEASIRIDTSDFLLTLKEQRGLQSLREQIDNWIGQRGYLLKSNEIGLDELNSTLWLRKQLLLDFLRKYTGELDTYIELAGEIDDFYHQVFQYSFQAFLNFKENQSQQNTHFVKTILDSALHSIVALKAIRNENNQIIDFEYKLVNQRCEEMMLRKKEDVQGKRLLELFPAVKETGIFEKYVKAVEEDQHFDLRFFYPFEGFETWFRQTFRKWDDGLVVMTVDITEDVKKEKDLVEKHKQLNRLSEKLTRANSSLEEAIQERTLELQTINDLNRLIAGELDLRKIIQEVTDVTTRLIKARFGAFFYNLENDKGESYSLYTVSGVPREMFSRLPVPLNTRNFDPVFTGVAVRSDDITRDESSGQNTPDSGMPEGHFPLKSYLAVPVISRTGKVLGVLYYGHEQAGIFSEKEEKLISAITTHASISIDNAHLFTALSRSEEKFRFMSETIPQIVWTADAEGNLDYFNQHWYDYSGLDYEQSKGYGWEQLLHPEDKEEALQRWSYSVKTGEPFQVECRFRRSKDGIYRWQLGRALPMKNRQGEIIKWFGTSTEIHDQKIAEKQLKAKTLELEENQLLLQFITDNLPAYVSYIDKDLCFQFANKPYYSMPYVKDQIVGKSMEDLMGVEEFMAVKPHIESVLKGKTVSYAYKTKVKKEGIKELEVKLIPDLDANGEVEGFIVMAIDLTERLRFERELAEKNKVLTKINTDLDNFIYTASHDLKSPVSNIEGLVYTIKDLLEEDAGKEELGQIVEMVERSIVRFKNTIQDLTEISRIQRAEEVEMEKVNLAEVFEEVMYSVKELMEKSNVSLQVSLAACPWVKLNKAAVKSILYNLVSNAIKFRHPERDPDICISSYVNNGFTVIEVSDNGLGLADYHKERLFTMFKRFHDHVEGTGIGLYIIKRIVENAGGKIEVESKLNIGSTFKVFLKEDRTC